MINPVVGSIVKLFARDLKAGMKMIENGETVEILESRSTSAKKMPSHTSTATPPGKIGPGMVG